ncbi:MAG: GNAT family N-acetyltransferase, partial [Anaerolineae bacterium]|nr:GNAT family N-acetyltransferase [Anaerolineae bacterium]
VAGMLMLNTGKTAVYGYGNSTSDPEIKKLNPTKLLVWEAIKASKQAGFETFDFGTTPLHHENLLAVKKRFNPVTEHLAYAFYLNTRPSLPTIQRDSKSIQVVEKGLQMLPRPLFRRLSPLLLLEVG